MEHENQTLGHLQQRTCKVMHVKKVTAGIEIQFATTTGDVFFGVVTAAFAGIDALGMGDIAYMEFFEYPERAKVEFETISKLDRKAIQNTPNKLTADEKEFFIKRQEILKSDIGYKALFVDSSKHGRPLRAYFLMQDNSLSIINYHPDSDVDLTEQFTSAREYLKFNEKRLARAGDFDAIRQLADYLASN